MKNLFITATILVACLTCLNACKQAGAINSTTTNEKPKTNETANISSAPTSPKEAKTPSEKDIEKGSVKADDYKENLGSKGKSSNLCDVEAYLVDKDPNGLNVRDSAKAK